MENRINVAELLKDCPLGIELNCTMYNNVTFRYILTRSCYPIQIQTPEGTMQLSKYGCMSLNKDAKCVIFPKGKTTWEGFVPPCQFKDGDIVYIKTNAFEYIFIFKINKDDRFIEGHATLSDSSLYVDGHPICEADDVKEIRLATETERTKLFDAIKARGYYWDSDTKTLETLIKPKFKIGDKVRHKNNHNVVVTITNIEKDYYACGTTLALWFDDQDQYELVPNKFNINTLVPFESRVLIRDHKGAKWRPAIWGCYDNEKHIPYPYVVVGGLAFARCIPYEGNEYLCGTTDDCNDFYKTWE